MRVEWQDNAYLCEARFNSSIYVAGAERQLSFARALCIASIRSHGTSLLPLFQFAELREAYYGSGKYKQPVVDWQQLRDVSQRGGTGTTVTSVRALQPMD